MARVRPRGRSHTETGARAGNGRPVGQRRRIGKTRGQEGLEVRRGPEENQDGEGEDGDEDERGGEEGGARKERGGERRDDGGGKRERGQGVGGMGVRSSDSDRSCPDHSDSDRFYNRHKAAIPIALALFTAIPTASAKDSPVVARRFRSLMLRWSLRW